MTQQLTAPPVARAEMLVRKPVAEVFEAFVEPAITSRFWFTRGSARLQAAREIQWDWEMYKLSVQVTVKALERNRRILIEWSAYGSPTTVEWVFTSRPDETTFVSITSAGFSGDADAVARQAITATEGFALSACRAQGPSRAQRRVESGFGLFSRQCTSEFVVPARSLDFARIKPRTKDRQLTELGKPLRDEGFRTA